MLLDGDVGYEQVILLHIRRPIHQIGLGDQPPIELDFGVYSELFQILKIQHIQQGGLARTTRAHDGQTLARANNAIGIHQYMRWLRCSGQATARATVTRRRGARHDRVRRVVFVCGDVDGWRAGLQNHRALGSLLLLPARINRDRGRRAVTARRHLARILGVVLGLEEEASIALLVVHVHILPGERQVRRAKVIMIHLFQSLQMFVVLVVVGRFAAAVGRNCCRCLTRRWHVRRIDYGAHFSNNRFRN